MAERSYLQLSIGCTAGVGRAIFNGNLPDIPLPSDQRTIYHSFNISGFETNGPNPTRLVNAESVKVDTGVRGGLLAREAR
jgi:hypothetical protein